MRRRVTRAEENIGDDVDTARRVALDALNMMEVDIPVPFSRDVESSDGGRCAFAPLVFATLLGNAMDASRAELEVLWISLKCRIITICISVCTEGIR